MYQAKDAAVVILHKFKIFDRPCYAENSIDSSFAFYGISDLFFTCLFYCFQILSGMYCIFCHVLFHRICVKISNISSLNS